MTATGIRASGSAWPPARWQAPPDDASSRTRCAWQQRQDGRDETKEYPPRADIRPSGGMEKGRGGAVWGGGAFR